MANYFRNFRLLLYPDNPQHALAMTALENGNIDYVCVLHDRDLKDDGQLAKPHFHYVVSFKDAKTISAAEKWFSKIGIESRFVIAITSGPERKEALRYLLHLDNPEKFQYSVTDASGSLVPVLTALAVTREDENARVLAVLDLVNSFGRKEISYTSFVRKCCESDLWGTLRHMGTWGVKVVDEHNQALFERYHLNDND